MATSALLLLAAASDAQQLRRVSGPLRSASLDLVTGAITRGALVDEKGVFTYDTLSVMNNISFNGFAGTDTGIGTAPFGPCEWFTALPTFGLPGQTTGGGSQWMSAMTFIYCTGAKSLSSGGSVGGAATITFREGYMRGAVGNAAGPSGTIVAQFALTGLPGHTGSSSSFGSNTCYFINVELPPTVLNNGPIGYAWQFDTAGVGGVLASTYPWLSCVQSCAGPGPSGLGGLIDVIDQYCPSGSPIRSSFTFGTSAGGSYFTSISMDIRKAQPVLATSAMSNGMCNTNPIGLAPLAGTTAPVLGEPWGVTANCTGADASKKVIIVVSFVPQDTKTIFGELLIGITPGQFLDPPFLGDHLGGSIDWGPLPLPLDFGLYNGCWYVQALCGDSPKGFLTNRLDQTVGN